MNRIASRRGRPFVLSALMSTVLTLATGLANASAASATPGIEANGMNTWDITSVPVMGSLKVDAAAHAALPESIRKAGVLTIGAITDEPPFIFSVDGKLQGIDLDMIGGLAKVLGVKIRLVKTSFDGMIPGMQSGRFDVVMGDLTDTTEREKIVDFIDYLQNSQTVITRKDDTRDFSKPLSICGFSAAAPKGSLSVQITQELSDICTSKGLKPIAIQTYPGSAPGFLALDTGRVDTVPLTYAIAVFLVSQHADKYKLTDSLFYNSYKGAAVLKDKTAMRDALTKGFQAIIDSPNYKQALANWGLQKINVDKVYVNVPGQPLSKTVH